MSILRTTLGAQDEEISTQDRVLTCTWLSTSLGWGGGGWVVTAKVFPALWGHSWSRSDRLWMNSHPALASAAPQGSLHLIPQHPVCASTHTQSAHSGKYHSRKPSPLDHPVDFGQNTLHAGLWHHKFHSSNVLHVKKEQWWKIHEVS